MLSFLAARAGVLGEQFLVKHPGAWVVWEPGRWHAPAGNKTVAGSQSPQTPTQGDALCFQLHLGPAPGTIRVGRDSTKSDLVVNDSTVSREHLRLVHLGDDKWTVEPTRDRVVRLDGRALPQGRPTPLKNGVALVLGSTRLTFYDPQGFRERLQGALKPQT
jgi:hypothetical protein